MAAQFCMKCGKPVAPDAAFCAGCGNPTSPAAPASSGGAPSAPANPPAPIAPSPAPTAAPAPLAASPAPPASSAPADPAFSPPPVPAVSDGAALRAQLGVAGCRNFLVQHELMSNGRNYRILNHEKKHLFTVRESVREELEQGFLGAPRLRGQGLLGAVAPNAVSFVWTVADAAGTPQGTITIQVQGNDAVSTLTDGSGAPVLAVNVQRSLMGGLTATAAYPDGRAMFEAKGNMHRHNFALHDGSGAEVAKIHEAWASMRDTYNLDLQGDTDPLCALVFAILIDREKAAG